MPKGVIFVTGAGRGIDAAIARALASDNWQIAGLSLIPDRRNHLSRWRPRYDHDAIDI